MQNKQAIVGIIAATVILVGAGSIFLLNKNKSEAPSTSPATSHQATKTDSSSQSSLQDIFSSGSNRKCTFDDKSGKSETLGTFYVSKDNARGTLTTTANGKTNNTYLIRNKDTFYIWGDQFPSGFKMTMSVEEMSSKISSNQYTNVDPNKKVDFKCSTWTVDPTMFLPPANVHFMDTGSVMTHTTGAQSAPSSQCNLCNSMTGQAKTTCITSFHCQ